MLVLGQKCTATIVVHLQRLFDPQLRALPGCQRLVDSRKCGTVLEHNYRWDMRAADRALRHNGLLNLQSNLANFDYFPVVNYRRFILCGGSVIMPDGSYPSEVRAYAREKATYQDEGYSNCHFMAFVSLVWEIEKELSPRDPAEIHLCSDSLYFIAKTFIDGREEVLIGLPPHKQDDLEHYRSFLAGKRLPHSFYFDGCLVKSSENAQIHLYYWRSADDLLAVLPGEPVPFAV